MSTQKIGTEREKDILDVMREIEAGKAPAAPRIEEDAAEAGNSNPSRDPADLLVSLRKKRELLSLLDGYSEAKGIVDRKKELEEAIGFLEELSITLAE
ncbi:MAG: hypothetical protein JXA24_00840 [Proteobacteria bacterium]|nr:hypothetical protein [Pseudomonadota bacterium]